MIGLVPACWLVVAADGYESVHRERALAERYASKQHGTVEPLVRLSAVETLIEQLFERDDGGNVGSEAGP